MKIPPKMFEEADRRLADRAIDNSPAAARTYERSTTIRGSQRSERLRLPTIECAEPAVFRPGAADQRPARSDRAAVRCAGRAHAGRTGCPGQGCISSTRAAVPMHGQVHAADGERIVHALTSIGRWQPLRTFSSQAGHLVERRVVDVERRAQPCAIRVDDAFGPRAQPEVALHRPCHGQPGKPRRSDVHRADRPRPSPSGRRSSPRRRRPRPRRRLRRLGGPMSRAVARRRARPPGVGLRTIAANVRSTLRRLPPMTWSMKRSWMAWRAGSMFRRSIAGRTLSTTSTVLPGRWNRVATAGAMSALQATTTSSTPSTEAIVAALSSTLSRCPPSVPPQNSKTSG